MTKFSAWLLLGVLSGGLCLPAGAQSHNTYTQPKSLRKSEKKQQKAQRKYAKKQKKAEKKMLKTEKKYTTYPPHRF